MEVFCFPCGNNDAYDHFLNTIKKEVSIDEIKNGVSDDQLDLIKEKAGEQFRVWGIVPGPKNIPNWNKLDKGDLVYFYRDHKIIGYGKVKDTLQNPTVARNLWGNDENNNTWEYLVFIEDFKEKDVSSTKANGEYLMYQGFTKLSDENKDRVLELLSLEDEVETPITLASPSNGLSSIDAIIDEAFKHHKQIVLTGAPGTGKTYHAKKYVESHTIDENQYEFVQFHPSYDYTNFVEGLTPVVLTSSITDDPTFVRIDGIFKKFCRKVVMENYYSKNKKTPSTFEEFKKGYLYYENRVDEKNEKKYYFVIDEINRADLSKVFGELMFSLEASYRGISNPIKTQYKNLFTFEINDEGNGKLLDFDCFEEGFFIPRNVYIIGTMNDIDKSVESFDFALRRRFEWIEIKAMDIAYDSLKEIFDSVPDDKIKALVNKINALNEVISNEGRRFGLSDAYHIGHAYFKNIDFDDETSLETIFKHNIVSILKEYTRGRNKEDVDDFIRKCADAMGVNY